MMYTKELIKNRINKDTARQFLMFTILSLLAYLAGSFEFIYILTIFAYLHFGYKIYFEERVNIDKKSFKVYWYVFTFLILFSPITQWVSSLIYGYWLYLNLIIMIGAILSIILVYLYFLNHWLKQTKLSNDSFGIVVFLVFHGIARSIFALIMIILGFILY